MSSLRIFQVAKIGLSEILTHLPNVIFAKISRREKFPIYGITYAEVVVIHIFWRPVIKLVPVYTIVWYHLEEQLFYFKIHITL